MPKSTIYFDYNVFSENEGVHTTSEYISTSSGSSDANKPVKTNNEGKLDPSILDQDTIFYNLNKIRKDQILLALEIASMKDQDLDPSLEIMVDSFNDTDNLDQASKNYEINRDLNYITPKQDGNLIFSNSDRNNFLLGVLNDTEVAKNINGLDSIRKLQTITGNKILLEDFEENSDIYNTNELEKSSIYKYQGSHSAIYNVNFNNTTNQIIIPLTTQISTYNKISLVFLRFTNSIYDYKITIQDNNNNTWQSDLISVSNPNNWFTWSENVNTLTNNGIDVDNLKELKIDFIEDLNAQILLDRNFQSNTGSFRVTNDRLLKQTFVLTTEDIKIGRLKLNIGTRNELPRKPLYVGISDFFETTLASTVIFPEQLPNTTNTTTDIICNLDSEITLIKDRTYTLIFKTGEEDDDYGFDIRYGNNNQNNGTLTYRDWWTYTDTTIVFQLLRSLIDENIYIDNLEVSAKDTYVDTGMYISRNIDLNYTPTSIDNFYWNTTGSGGASLRIRMADTEIGLNSATWSNWFSDATGVNNDLSMITPKRWFQYQITFFGTVDESSYITNIALEYFITGETSATIISKIINTVNPPTKFKFRFQDALESGNINYFISSDNGANWQTIDRTNEGEDINFVNSGSEIKLKASITGDAKIFGWAVAFDEEIV